MNIFVAGLVRAAAQCLRIEAFIFSWPDYFVVTSEVRVS